MSIECAVIINPISGTGGRLEIARARAEHAAALIERYTPGSAIFLTERPGHARELTAAALSRGATRVIAWGGDGTVNEVASALAFREASIAIVPSGSGNGLGRELKVPFDPDAAFDVAFRGRDMVIDAGELDGRLFFNIAGIGLDAQVAHRFAMNGLRRRGFARYIAITAHELFTYRAREHTISADGVSRRVRTMLIAIANARQYGNGALIAPAARLDDGLLDLVVIQERSALAALVQAPAVFMGRIAQLPGVTASTAVEITIGADQPVLYHVDGEPYVGGTVVTARPRRNAVHVMVPA